MQQTCVQIFPASEMANELHTAERIDVMAPSSIIKGRKTPPGRWATLLLFLNLQQRRGVAPSAQPTWNKMGYLELTSFALVEKGQLGNETPPTPTVQHWLSLISQFTLCFAASLVTILLYISTSNCCCHLSIQHEPYQDLTRSSVGLLLIIWILSRKKKLPYLMRFYRCLCLKKD